MFTVYHSNQLDLLKTLAAWQMENQPIRNPFRPEVILVQSQGMAQWLQMSLATQFGIAANLSFPLPARFIWDMFMQVLPDVPEESAFTLPGMSWKLMAILPELLPRPEFSPLRHYLSDDDDKRKLFQLSSRIAGLFDQYLIYRAEWLTHWENGELIDGIGQAQHWQAPLWQALVTHTRQMGQPTWHRAALCTRFITVLENSAVRPDGLPERLFICGISALPPIYLQVLQALGKHIDVHLLFTNPCRHYWGDIQDYAFLAKLQSRRRQHYQQPQTSALFSQENAASLFNEQGEQQLTNPLLASWGKSGRDNLFFLAQMECREIDAFVDIEPDTLLRALQRDILELEDHAVIGLNEKEWKTSHRKRQLDPQDRSVSVHICHSAQREVEVLQDCLLDMMAKDPSLLPRDIVVMVADIDAYAPFIQAVFSHAPPERYLPFTLSDRRASQLHPALQAFITLLGLPDSRFTASEVFTLLEVPAIASRFSIDESGLKRLRKWVNESGVRWGLDDDMLRDLDLLPTGQHTWQFGISRMLLGYAIPSEAGDWQGILPYDESSGLIAELAGNLAELLRCLSHWREAMRVARPLDKWLPLCRELLDDFFSKDTDTEAALAVIEAQWEEAIGDGIKVHYSSAVPLILLRDELAARLEKQRISQRFLSGPVNFCTLMPMRSIPFKVVCLLGMNDGVYPRAQPPLGFDLINQHPRRGDRSRREDDRYLFLEALNSAQQQFYISYTGCTIQDNSPRFPSVLVSELTDYISQSFCLPQDTDRDVDSSASAMLKHLQHVHSRMPFAAENFSSCAIFRSYAAEWLPAANASGVAHRPFVQPLATLVVSESGFEQVSQFWRHPVRAFFNHRLGVSFKPEEAELSDTEPFVLDSLSRYQLNVGQLNALIAGEPAESIYARQRAAGQIPYGAWGELFWQDQLATMTALATRVIEQRKPTSNWEINLHSGTMKLNGWLPQVQTDGLLRWRPAKLKLIDGLSLWLEHLVYCTLGGTGVSRMLGCDESQWCFQPLPAEQAAAWLARYITGYQQGMNAPLLLLPKSGAAWLMASVDQSTAAIMQDEKTQAKARALLLEAWRGGYKNEGESRDPYLSRLFRHPDDNTVQEIARQAETWLLPLLQQRDTAN